MFSIKSLANSSSNTHCKPDAWDQGYSITPNHQNYDFSVNFQTYVVQRNASVDTVVQLLHLILGLAFSPLHSYYLYYHCCLVSVRHCFLVLLVVPILDYYFLLLVALCWCYRWWQHCRDLIFPTLRYNHYRLVKNCCHVYIARLFELHAVVGDGDLYMLLV